ncbi:MAG TPA: hypothetical protein DCE31_07805 [Lautropia sp.]|nr:hypothetical protein [Lautropia sp.]
MSVESLRLLLAFRPYFAGRLILRASIYRLNFAAHQPGQSLGLPNFVQALSWTTDATDVATGVAIMASDRSDAGLHYPLLLPEREPSTERHLPRLDAGASFSRLGRSCLDHASGNR